MRDYHLGRAFTITDNTELSIHVLEHQHGGSKCGAHGHQGGMWIRRYVVIGRRNQLGAVRRTKVDASGAVTGDKTM